MTNALTRSYLLMAIVVSQLTWVGASLAAVPIPNPTDRSLDKLNIPDNATTVGMWSGLHGWPLVGNHSALQPTGKILTYGSPLNAGVQDGRTFDLWNPLGGLEDPATHYTLPGVQHIDSFCSGTTFLTGYQSLRSA